MTLYLDLLEETRMAGHRDAGRKYWYTVAEGRPFKKARVRQCSADRTIPG